MFTPATQTDFVSWRCRCADESSNVKQGIPQNPNLVIKASYVLLASKLSIKSVSLKRLKIKYAL